VHSGRRPAGDLQAPEEAAWKDEVREELKEGNKPDLNAGSPEDGDDIPFCIIVSFSGAARTLFQAVNPMPPS
jgi:hypothetical protein